VYFKIACCESDIRPIVSHPRKRQWAYEDNKPDENLGTLVKCNLKFYFVPMDQK